MAISCPLLETSVDGARGILINIIGPMDMDFEEVSDATDLIQAVIHPDANMIFGATFDDSLDDEIRVNVIATGFDKKKGAVCSSGGSGAFRGGSPRDHLDLVFSFGGEKKAASGIDDFPDDIMNLFNNR